jgi:hypothetical protein
MLCVNFNTFSFLYFAEESFQSILILYKEKCCHKLIKNYDLPFIDIDITNHNFSIFFLIFFLKNTTNFLVFSREESFNFSNSIGLDFKIK